MANPNPVEARMAQRNKNRKNRRGIDLQELRVIVSDFIEALDAHLSRGDGETPVSIEKLKGIGYLLTQAVGTYTKLVEVGELEARTEKMQAQIDELREEARNARIPA